MRTKVVTAAIGVMLAACARDSVKAPAVEAREAAAEAEADAGAGVRAREAADADAYADVDADADARTEAAARGDARAGAAARGGAAARADADADARGESDPASIPPEMAPVPGGTFTMGADTGGQDDEHPAHAVTLRPFLLDRLEVTNADYAACVTAHACGPNNMHIASITKSGNDADFTRPRRPVVGVAWADAHAYCAWRGKRLPREAEMERAIRGDDGRRFPWGNDAPTPERTVFGRNLGTSSPDDVGTHPSGRGPYGHDDLAGNVWEWMEDDYDPYAYRRAGAPEGIPGTCKEILAAQDELRAQGKQGFTGSNPIPTECEKSIRAGAFNYDGPGLRSTNRVHHPPRYRLVMLGFRCAL